MVERNFTTKDCSIWLLQSAVVRMESFNDRYLTESWEDGTIVVNTDLIESDERFLQVVFIISIILFTLFSIQTIWNCQWPGFSHILLLLWILVQIP